MEERVLVYKSPNYDDWEKRYKWMREQLQKLADGLKSLGIEPTKDLIMRLYNGENLEEMTAKKHISEQWNDLPHTILQTISDLYKKERTDEYNEAVGKQALKLSEWRKRNESTTLILINHFDVENGNVIISPDHISYLEKLFCVFVDNDNKRKVYDKWLQLKKAKMELEVALKLSQKRNYTQWEKDHTATGYDLMAVSTAGQFCLVKVRYDGEMFLNGENFSHLL